MSYIICNIFLTIAASEPYFETGLDAEKSLFNQTLVYPFKLNPICYYWGLKGPTTLASFLYPFKALKCRLRMSGKGICWRPYKFNGILYKKRRPWAAEEQRPAFTVDFKWVAETS